MKLPLFISLDGPKGTGKTTLLEAVTAALRADKHKVIRLCERKSDPYRGETMALVNQLARHPSRDLEWAVCQRLADSRRWISERVLPKQPLNSIILIDRWYPSDAAFRHSVPFAEILQLNIERGVRVPDLHVGVVTAPDISWARAGCCSRFGNGISRHSRRPSSSCASRSAPTCRLGRRRANRGLWAAIFCSWPP